MSDATKNKYMVYPVDLKHKGNMKLGIGSQKDLYVEQNILN